MITVRDATADDLDYIVDLAEARRAQYEAYQPVFWHRASDARERHRPFLQWITSRDDAWLLVAEVDGRRVGFAYASVVAAPPVYDPGGKVCFIDDYAVDAPELWPSAGRALAEAAFERAKPLGAVLGNIVVSPRDTQKLALIEAMGFSVATEWRVRPL